ncbi:MAG: methylmalonyl-CoA mutase family protein [Aigarchaeota archaeon]|nr:methylmalonyl-CoA mutase family protein [Candidatus Pelearchaeum maunauluense]
MAPVEHGYSRDFLERLKSERERWENITLRQWIEKTGVPERDVSTTASGIPIKRVFTPEDMKDIDYFRDIGFPGEYPYTRGIYPNMYRGRMWTIRMVTGYGTPEETNRRFKFMLEHGETGLNLVLDSPSIYGYDSDDPRVRGEVGQGGSPISSLYDMETAFEDIPIDRITTSLITYFVGMPIFAMFVAMARKRGLDVSKIGGTTQNDTLMLFHVGNPPLPLEPALKLSVDLLEWCAYNMPRWYAISVCGYQLREAGATAVQEAAFTIADAMVYVEEAMRRGLTADQAARHISFFLCVHNDFFEEVAKFRAMRKVWAKLMRERYKARDPRSWLFKFHAQTSGVALTAQEPENNIVRTAYHALAAVLGGVQSLHTDAMDEALGLPTEKAARIALRTQQILFYETGVANVVDPLAGSYYVEYLTKRVEEAIWRKLDEIEAIGGMLEATRRQLPRKEISDSRYETLLKIESGEIPVVGVNIYQARGSEKPDIELLRVTLELEEKQVERVRYVKRMRNDEAVRARLEELREAARQNKNLTPYAIEAASAYATVGEIYEVFREVYGTQQALAWG